MRWLRGVFRSEDPIIKLVGALSEPDAQELMEFNDALQEEVNVLSRVAHSLITDLDKVPEGRKNFALNMAPHLEPKWLAGVCFGIMDGKGARMLVLKAVQKHYDDLGVRWRGE